MDYYYEYDETDPKSIELHGKKLIGKTFADVCRDDEIYQIKKVTEQIGYEANHENKKRKGGLGELIEERHFHYAANGDAQADFAQAGVELKVTPYQKKKNGSVTAKERLVLSMIDYNELFNSKCF